MKLFVRLMIFIVVLGLAGPFIMKGPDGRPLMTVDDLGGGGLSWDSLSYKAKALWADLTGSVSNVTDTQSEQSTTVYKWRDSEGNWQFSDRPNPTGSSETVVVDANVNIIKSTPVPERKKETSSDAQSPQIGVPLPMTIAPDKVSKLMKDAKQVQELMNKRNEALEGLSGTRAAEDN